MPPHLLLSLTVGSIPVSLSITLSPDRDPISIVSECIQEAHLPHYLLAPASRVVRTLLREHLIRSAPDVLSFSTDAVMAKAAEWNTALQPQTHSQAMSSFSLTYHTVIHSSREASEALLRRDHEFAMQICESERRRSRQIRRLQSKQAEQVEQATMPSKGPPLTTDQIASLVNSHVLEMAKLEDHWKQSLHEQKQKQIEEYRSLVFEMKEWKRDEQSVPPEPAPLLRWASGSSISEPKRKDEDGGNVESFTVYLGAQQKTMYTVRLAVGEVVDLCRYPTVDSVELIVAMRAESALFLYSDQLSAVIVVASQNAQGGICIDPSFIQLCNDSTELHFDSINTQIEALQAVKFSDGDFAVTRHSNLRGAHVAFHLVATDSDSDNLLLGLRNVLAACAEYDVVKVAVPLFLLVPQGTPITKNAQMVDRMTELVMKHVKAHLTEAGRAGLNQFDQVQLFLPLEASSLFTKVRSQLVSVFRV